jgi:two-component system OmpR family sensor kinase/two-component system sensor histidine kinase BaeS
MNRLWVQLTLAFTLVILVAVGSIAVLIQSRTGIEFRQYITHSGMQGSGSGMRQLVAYFEGAGSWEGVDSLLSGMVFVGGPMGMPMSPRERRAGRTGAGLDVLLADAGGKIVFDSTDQDEGKRLDARERARALPITRDGGDVIGYLLLSVPGSPERLGTLEERFLDRMRNVLVAGAALAVVLGLVLGAILSRRLTAPLQRLAFAARAVGAGDLGQQVRVEGSAEIAEVGHAFNDMTAALEEEDRLRQNLMADVAHELRTPLSVVQGNLRAILDDVYPLDKSEISRLYDETRLLSRLVDDLRELALADAGQLRLNLRPTNVAGVVQSTANSLALVAEAQEVILRVELPGGLPAIEADADRLAQVLRNLLVNALRHTPPGGTVTVAAALRGRSVEIAVSDTGEGIAPDDVARVFDRFWRADRSRSRAGGSSGESGLGLPIAQSLVEAHGGRIWMESEPGRGSVVRFTLPLRQGSS